MSRPQRTIFFIEADPVARDTAQRSLEQSGFVVRPVENTSDAVAKLQAEAPADVMVGVSSPPVRDALRELELRVEQKTAELNALQREHAQAEKLAALGTLLAGVVHEIGSPLTVLESNLEGLLEAAPGDQAQMLEDLRHATGRIARLTATLRKLSRPQQAHQWCELAPALEEVLTLIRARLPSQPIELAIDPTVRQVYLSHDDLVSVISNLAINAGHALEGKPGGTIRISLERSGPRAVLSVSDDGCGIKPENLQRVLDPFFTTKKAGHGTGLGLSLVDQMIRSVGGSLTVDSTVDVGTTVSAVLRVI